LNSIFSFSIVSI